MRVYSYVFHSILFVLFLIILDNFVSTSFGYVRKFSFIIEKFVNVMDALMSI